jgi:hypothetical protein
MLVHNIFASNEHLGGRSQKLTNFPVTPLLNIPN